MYSMVKVSDFELFFQRVGGLRQANRICTITIQVPSDISRYSSTSIRGDAKTTKPISAKEMTANAN